VHRACLEPGAGGSAQFFTQHFFSPLPVRIAGPFRQGQALPPRVGDVDTKALKSGSIVEFSGTEDTVRVQLVGRRVQVLTYLCVPD